jgi:hypothetical protein
MSVGVAAAIGIGSAVAGVGSIAGGLIAKGGAKDAADAAASAQREGIASQERLAREGLGVAREQNAWAQGQLAPFIQSQLSANRQLAAFADPNNSAYSEQRDFSTRQIQQQLAAQGLLRSRGQGDSLANLELGLNQQRLGVIQGLAGTGAAQNAAQLAQGYGGQAAQILGGAGQGIGSSLAQMGQTQMQGILGQTQAIGGIVGGLGNIVQGGIGSLTQLKMLQALTGKSIL